MVSTRVLCADLFVTAVMACCVVGAHGLSRRDKSSQSVPPPPPAASTRNPYRSSGPPVPLSHEPSGIAWGSGRDLQAGMMLSGRYGSPGQATGMYVFDVYLRNVSKQAITADCPNYDGLSVPRDGSAYTTLIQSFEIYCSPSIKDVSGNPVSVNLRQGANHAGITLGPGQCVMVSHWMLRTMKLAMKTAESAKYSQVAFVEPGKYTVACSLRASWGSPAHRRAVLSTGVLGFTVTDDDLAQ